MWPVTQLIVLQSLVSHGQLRDHSINQSWGKKIVHTDLSDLFCDLEDFWSSVIYSLVEDLKCSQGALDTCCGGECWAGSWRGEAEVWWVLTPETPRHWDSPAELRAGGEKEADSASPGHHSSGQCFQCCRAAEPGPAQPPGTGWVRLKTPVSRIQPQHTIILAGVPPVVFPSAHILTLY